jgi:hypothetical protein
MRAKYYAGHTTPFLYARALFFCMTGVSELDLNWLYFFAYDLAPPLGNS